MVDDIVYHENRASRKIAVRPGAPAQLASHQIPVVAGDMHEIEFVGKVQPLAKFHGGERTAVHDRQYQWIFVRQHLRCGCRHSIQGQADLGRRHELPRRFADPDRFGQCAVACGVHIRMPGKTSGSPFQVISLQTSPTLAPVLRKPTRL